MNYQGIIIEESLSDTSVLKEVTILSTTIEPIKERHKTPWLKQWTKYLVEFPEAEADQITSKLSKDLERKYWYADYKNDKYHIIVFKDKIFKVDLSNPVLYKEAEAYGLALGIPPYQVDFRPDGSVSGS